MTKLFIADDLRRRISYAAKNGSAVATLLLSVITEGRNKDIHELVGDSTCNYFDSKVLTNTNEAYQDAEIQISYCSKDVTNPHNPDFGNPDAPYFKSNRTYTSPTNFAKFFTEVADHGFTDIDWAYFDSAIRLASKVTIIMSDKMSDFLKAYLYSNYAFRIERGCRTLHNSCMRYEDKAPNVADFYSHVAGASILYAKDDSGNVLARAVVWKDVDFGEYGKLSFIERTYFSYNFLLSMLRSYAKEHGVHFYKTYNEIGKERYFTALRDFDAADGTHFTEGDNVSLLCTKKVPAIRWHKQGAPYCDTMVWMSYRDGELILKNYSDSDHDIARFHSTYGYAERNGYICPCCGKVHYSSDGLCSECRDQHMSDTAVGPVMQCSVKTYKGMKLPSFLFSNGAVTPNKNTLSWIAVRRLFN